jgi:nicotinamidase-related amidase
MSAIAKKLNRDDAILVVVDMQERIIAAMHEADKVTSSCEKLIRGSVILDIPFIFTQQYSKGLGRTIPEISEATGAELFTFIEKNTFSIMDEPDFTSNLEESGRKDIIIAGIETHVCVQQSVLDLLNLGYRVFVDADSVGSRNLLDKKFSLKRMEAAGAVVTTTEAILFELLRGSKAPGFKDISNLVK